MFCETYLKPNLITPKIIDDISDIFIYSDQKQIFSPPDHVVILETLPLVVIHGHFMNPLPPPLTTWYMDAPF